MLLRDRREPLRIGLRDLENLLALIRCFHLSLSLFLISLVANGRWATAADNLGVLDDSVVTEAESHSPYHLWPELPFLRREYLEGSGMFCLSLSSSAIRP